MVIKHYNKADSIITPTETIKKLIKEKGITKPIKVISNGIIKFTPKKEYKTKHSLLHFGRISYEKKVDIILKAIHLLKKTMQDIQLTIIGDGPDMKRLKKMTKELMLENNVTFKGWIKNKDLQKEIIKHDVFITASTMETQGIAILESMACGLPIIGVNKYAIPELITDNGYLAEPDNPEDMATGIVKVLRDKNIKKLGENSIRIANKHKIENTIKKLEELYTKKD